MKHINALEKVQKHFTKRIASLSNLSYHERLAALDLELLELRRLESDFVLYCNCLPDLVVPPSSEYFTVELHLTNVTGGIRLLRPLYSTKHYENDFFNRCVSCWNFLPPAVVNTSSISCFKRLLSNVDLSYFTKNMCIFFVRVPQHHIVASSYV